MKVSLNNLPLKKGAVIKNISTNNTTRERLHSIGIIEGVEIAFIRNTPLGCPKIYKCFNTLIAIRNNTAEEIEIKSKKCSD
jgi:Fe2+ transport system protein FeoA